MAEVIRIDPERLKARHVARIVEVLRGGGVVIYPTDTVYGFGCDLRRRGRSSAYGGSRGVTRKTDDVCARDLTNISRYSRVSISPTDFETLSTRTVHLRVAGDERDASTGAE